MSRFHLLYDFAVPLTWRTVRLQIISGKDRKKGLMCHFYFFWLTCDWRRPDVAYINTGFDTEPEVADSSLPLPDTSKHADRERKTLWANVQSGRKLSQYETLGAGVKSQFNFYIKKKRPLQIRKRQEHQHRWKELNASLQFKKMQPHDRKSQSEHDDTSFDFATCNISNTLSSVWSHKNLEDFNPLDS